MLPAWKSAIAAPRRSHVLRRSLYMRACQAADGSGVARIAARTRTRGGSSSPVCWRRAWMPTSSAGRSSRCCSRGPAAACGMRSSRMPVTRSRSCRAERAAWGRLDSGRGRTPLGSWSGSVARNWQGIWRRPSRRRRWGLASAARSMGTSGWYSVSTQALMMSSLPRSRPGLASSCARRAARLTWPWASISGQWQAMTARRSWTGLAWPSGRDMSGWPVSDSSWLSIRSRAPGVAYRHKMVRCR